ncbi:MAG: pilus assembly protein PilM [Candidatus Omnitrophica bacterium]|nr:pilus assembly protein PilM [Candidatus Omnitrophota bacterium]
MDLNALITNLRTRFFKLRQDNKTSIGLDWDVSLLKILVLESQKNSYMIKDARIIELPSQDLNLSALIKGLDLSDGVNLGICGPNVIVRYVAMAKMNESEFRNSLKYEAASHLPFSAEEVNLDGVILKDLPDNQMLVMLAAAKKDFINERLRLCQEAGIKVNILDIDSLALINAFNYIHQQKDVSSGALALLNIGASVTNINILENGIPHFSREIDVAGEDFTTKEASREVAIANFVGEIRKSFDYYETRSTTVINKIFLSGVGNLISELTSNLKNLLGIQIKQWDPFCNFDFAPGLDEINLRKNSAQFAVAVGLALR